MGFFDLFAGDNKKDKRYRDQELANMYEQGWDESEETKYDKKALEREKWSNYEYSDEE